MNKKLACKECGKEVRSRNLHRSIEDHKLICNNCYRKENKNRNELKLKILSDYDKELTNSTEKRKKVNLLGFLFKFRGGLLNDKVKRYERWMK